MHFSAGWIGEFLSWEGFAPLSRLTYGAYLTHDALIRVLVSGARNGVFYTKPLVVSIVTHSRVNKLQSTTYSDHL